MRTRSGPALSRRRSALLGVLMSAVVLGLNACSSPTTDAPPAVGSAAASATAAAPGVPTTIEPPIGAAVPSADPVMPSVPATPVQAAPATTDAAPSAAPLVLPAAAPVSLTIPAINVTSPLSSLGRNPDGTVEVPSLEDPNAGAGWFRDSPEPGALGPSVILGHVDSREFGPGVFYDLGVLRPGDTIEIGRDDGSVAVFVVDSVETVPKASFPTLRVYGNVDHAGLRLITCGGSFDEDARSYQDNVIAFASLVSSRPA